MAVNLTPSLAAGLGAAPTDKAHLRGWLEAIVAAINSDLDPRATPIYASRAAAVTAAPSLPSSLTHIAVREGTALVIRSRTAWTDDPLFESGARWGVVQRQDSDTERTGRINAIRDTGVLPLANIAGTANAITADIAPAVPGVTLSALSTVELIPGAANTDAVTLNVGGAGNWPVQRRDGSALVAGDLKANVSLVLRRRGNAWRAIHALDSDMDGKVATEATARINATRDTGVLPLADVGGTANAITAVVAPSVGVTISGQSTVLLVPAADNTGAVTLSVNGAGNWPVQRLDGTPVQPGDLKAGIGRHYRRAGSAWRMLAEAPSEARTRAAAEAAPLVAAEAQARQASDNALSADLGKKVDGRNDPSGRLLSLEDEGGNVALYVEDGGGLVLAGMGGGTVQDRLQDAPASSENGNLLEIASPDGTIIARIDEHGGLHLPGRARAVQGDLKHLDGYARGKAALRSRSDLHLEAMTDYTPEAMAAVSRGLALRGGTVAPLPVGYLPTKTEFDWQQLYNLSIDIGSDPTPLVLDSPYAKDDKVVHPTLAHFPGGWNGYEWLLGMTPFAGSSQENPVIWGTNNLRDYQMIDWLPQPIAPQDRQGRGYLSDIAFSYDPIRGEFICIWRDLSGSDVPGGEGNAALYYRTTINGYDWSEPRLLQIASEGKNRGYSMSPNLRFNPFDGYWYLWAQSNDGAFTWRARTLRHDAWEPVSGVIIGNWHREVILIGRRALYIGSSMTGVNVNLALSDRDNWTSFTDFPSVRSVPVNTQAFTDKFPEVPQLNFYKVGASLEVLANGKGRLRLVWTNTPASSATQYRRAFPAVSSEFNLV